MSCDFGSDSCIPLNILVSVDAGELLFVRN